MEPNPQRLHNPKKRLISELRKNSDELFRLLKNIIEKSESPSLKENAKNSIKSIDELITLIEKSNIEDIKEIAITALDQ